MLDSILDSVKGQVIDTLKEKTGLDAGQAEQAVPLAGESIKEGIMGAVTGGGGTGIGDVLGMFSSGGNMAQNSVFQNIAGNFVGKLTSKIGIPASMASTVSTMALPMIMDKIKGKAANDQGEVTQDGIMSALGGGGGIGDMLKNKAGDMLKGKLGDLF